MRGGDQAEALVAPVWREVRECTRAILGSATIADAAVPGRRGPHVLHLTGEEQS